jgi:AAA domain, putative AbiEii toxin, Type IV TA system
MYITLKQIEQSLDSLSSMHPFWGINFLVAKKSKILVEQLIEVSLDIEEKKFLEMYYKPLNASEWFYRVFRPSDKNKKWLDAKFPQSGSQSTRTRGKYAEAFEHHSNTNLWAWKPDYIQILAKQLKKPFPLFHLAIWIYREKTWAKTTHPIDVLETFLADFFITPDEQKALFDVSIPKDVGVENLFQENPVTWAELRTIIGSPPDSLVEEGGTLTFLELEGIGPAKKLTFEPAERLSLITGDNGLGKTFLLECAWWALTSQWVGLPANPRLDAKTGKITFKVSNGLNETGQTLDYNWETQSWATPRERTTIPGLLIYGRVDGSFAVWDPVKSSRNTQVNSFIFSRNEVWYGLQDKNGRSITEGLLRDLVTWQSEPESQAFAVYKDVLKRLSPKDDSSDLGFLEPGNPVRIPDDNKKIPTIVHPYGEVPIVYASAGVQRIVALAYLIVWTWIEHQIHSIQARKEPQRRTLILIDEIEAHLHPKWQRSILPTLLGVGEELDREVNMQFIVATHSPLVLASVESSFNSDQDKLFHLDISKQNLIDSEVELKEQPFIRYGDMDSWLMSDIFDLKYPRSIEAERVIEVAKSLQKQTNPKSEDVRKVHKQLVGVLGEADEFWSRWLFFAEQHGVTE